MASWKVASPHESREVQQTVSEVRRDTKGHEQKHVQCMFRAASENMAYPHAAAEGKTRKRVLSRMKHAH
eukprot:4897419-Pleurochrysis_carterae.AAC.3